MKIIYTYQKPILKILAGSSQLILLFIFLSGKLVSQIKGKAPYNLDISLGSHLSGNAHGIIYDANIGLSNEKNNFSIGTCMQKRTLALCGASVNYKRLINLINESESTGESNRVNSKLQLFFYSRLQYVNDASLSYNAIKQEETLIKNTSEFPARIINSLSTIDLSVGAGLNFQLSKQLTWSNYIGFGTFYHLNYKNGMYCDKSAPVLALGTTLKFRLFKLN